MSAVDLYRFVEGALAWTFTSADEDHLYGFDSSGVEVYASETIGRSAPETRAELSKATMEVYLPLTHTLSKRWLRSFLDSPVTVTLFEHDPDDETIVSWKGRLAVVKPNTTQMVLGFESVFTSMRRQGLRRKYQRSCPHVLYRPGCNLDAADFGINAIVTAVSGKTVTVHLTSDAAQPDGWFSGGMLQAPDGSLRFIIAHTGDSITLIRPSEGLTPGAAIILFPGCDRSKETCFSKFNNLPNNGAFPYIPIVNPIGGAAII